MVDNPCCHCCWYVFLRGSATRPIGEASAQSEGDLRIQRVMRLQVLPRLDSVTVTPSRISEACEPVMAGRRVLLCTGSAGGRGGAAARNAGVAAR